MSQPRRISRLLTFAPESRIARITSAIVALAIGLGLSVAAATPATAAGSDAPIPYTVTATTLTLPSGATFGYNQEINYKVTKLDGTGLVTLGVGNNYPHNGVWPRDLYWGKSVYTWTDHPSFPSSYKTDGYCITWVQVGHYNEHFGEGGQAPVCYTPPPPVVPKWGVALYVYKKLNPALPAAWENSGLQTLIVQDVDNTSAAANNYWTVFPITLPAYICGPDWGVQQDKVSFTGTFNFPTNIEYPYDNIGWPPIYDATHQDLASLVTVPPCVDKDADATVQVWQPSCDVAGNATFTIANATWNSTPPTAPGGPYTITATANSGHVFADGTTTKQLVYSVADLLGATSPDCYNPQPVVPQFQSIAECGVFGSLDLVDTAYIHYALVSGDGKQGVNHVVATAIAPYVLKAGATAEWWIDLGDHWNCPQPTASSEVGPCFADESDASHKNLKVTFDNTDSVIPLVFTIPDLGVSESIAAGATDTVTVAIPASGSPSYDVFAGSKKVLTIDAISEFPGCIGAVLEGDPTHENATCEAGVTQDGSIWVDRKVGLEYTITDVTDASSPVVVATLAGTGDGTTSLAPGDYMVSVAPLPGYVLDVRDPATSGPWYYTVGEPEGGCYKISPPMISCLDASEGVLTLPAVFGVLWSVDGGTPAAGPIQVPLAVADKTITASPSGDNVAFSAGVFQWSFGLDEFGLCSDITTLASIPTAATATDEKCTTGLPVSGTITVGLVDGVSFFDEVNYYLDGSDTPMTSPTANVAPGIHTVTASPVDPDDTLEGESSWALTVAAATAACDLTTLAFTGDNSATWLLVAVLVLLAGAAFVLMAATRRRLDRN